MSAELLRVVRILRHLSWHVTHPNESRHTYEWFMSIVLMSHVTHMNESCRKVAVRGAVTGSGQGTTQTHGHSALAQLRVARHLWMNHVAHINESSHTVAVRGAITGRGQGTARTHSRGASGALAQPRDARLAQPQCLRLFAWPMDSPRPWRSPRKGNSADGEFVERQSGASARGAGAGGWGGGGVGSWCIVGYFFAGFAVVWGIHAGHL